MLSLMHGQVALKCGDKTLNLISPNEYIIGRGQETKVDGNHITFNAKIMSRQHALLVLTSDGKMSLKDTNSSNGTFVNSTQIQTTTTLFSNDLIVFGVEITDSLEQPIHSSVTCTIVSLGDSDTNLNKSKLAHQVNIAKNLSDDISQIRNFLNPINSTVESRLWFEKYHALSNTLLDQDALFTQNNQLKTQVNELTNLLATQQTDLTITTKELMAIKDKLHLVESDNKTLISVNHELQNMVHEPNHVSANADTPEVMEKISNELANNNHLKELLEFEKRLSELSTENDTKVSSLNSTISKMNQSYELDAKSKTLENDSLVQNLKTQHETILANKILEFEMRITKLGFEYETSLQSSNKSHDEITEEMEANHSQAITEITKMNDERISQIETQKRDIEKENTKKANDLAIQTEIELGNLVSAKQTEWKKRHDYDLNETIAKHHSIISDLETKYVTLESGLKSEIAELKKTHQNEVNDIILHRNGAIKEIKTRQVGDFKRIVASLVNELNKRHMEEITKIKCDHATNFEMTKKQYEHETMTSTESLVMELNKRHELAMHELSANHETDIEQINQKHEKDLVSTLESRINELKKRHEEEIVKMKSDEVNFTTTMKENTESLLKANSEQYQLKHEGMEKTHGEILKKIFAEHSLNSDALRSDYNDSLKNIEMQSQLIEALKLDMHTKISEYENQIDLEGKKYAQAIEKYESDIEMMNKQQVDDEIKRNELKEVVEHDDTRKINAEKTLAELILRFHCVESERDVALNEAKTIREEQAVHLKAFSKMQEELIMVQNEFESLKGQHDISYNIVVAENVELKEQKKVLEMKFSIPQSSEATSSQDFNLEKNERIASPIENIPNNNFKSVSTNHLIQANKMISKRNLVSVYAAVVVVAIGIIYLFF